MTNVLAFEKILTLRTTEKDMALKEYQTSVDQFEAVATQLYHLLREKEELEEVLDNQLQLSMTVYDIQRYQQYKNQLSEKIAKLQDYVQSARNKMEAKHAQLTDSFVEMKKFEKIVEMKKQAKIDEMTRTENEFLDEVSVQQFLRNGKR